jgi:hypothetical protein
MTRRGRSVVLGAALLAASLAVAGDGDAPKPAKHFDPETIDQPPAKESPRDDLAARTPPMRVATGPYVSIQVNVDASGNNIVGDAANEPSIAVNPLNPSNMVIGWRQFNSVSSNFRQAGWAYTFNKGATWTFPGVLTPGTFRSDPVIDVDALGVFYYQSLKSDFTLDVFKSFDGGATWGAPVPSFGGDKNWLAIDRSGGPGNGFLYGIWQRFASCCGLDTVTRSVDTGASFQSPVAIDFWPTFGMLAVGPDGTVFAAGIDGTTTQDFQHFVLSRSTNVPNAGTPPTFVGTRVDLGGAMDLDDAPNPGGLLGQANVAVDRSTGPTHGNVYVLASVSIDGFDPMDVNIARSVDGGQTFAPPVRVNDDPAIMTHWHWLAAHSVAPNGRIDVVWFDTRDSGQSNLSRLYYSYSWDAGTTWSPNVPVSPTFNSIIGWPNQSKMGDYSTIVSDARGADVAYCATYTGGQDVYYVRVFPDCNGNGIADADDIASQTSRDCNQNNIPDECETAPVCLGAGSVPDGGPVPGTPLTIDKGAGSAIVLSWGASCSAADTDYAVYEGALGDFADRNPVACGTGGAQTLTFTPAPDSTYYLVVPVHAGSEGSYGTDGSGNERAPGAGACDPQAILHCGP